MKTLEKISVYRDGGTILYVEKLPKDKPHFLTSLQTQPKYFLDGRFDSPTKGELFDRYPGDNGAKQVDKSQFIFIN